MVISLNVHFYEDHFPFLRLPSTNSSDPTVLPTPSIHKSFSHDFIPSPPNQPKLDPSPNPTQTPSPPCPLRRSNHAHHPPSYLQDYHHSFTSTSTNLHPGMCYPIQDHLSYSHLSNNF
ncbi:hypothetical protein V8G54_037175, partial [Vigna mungo]